MERLEAQPDAISERNRFTKNVLFDTVQYGTSVSMRITRCAQNKTDKNISQVPVVQQTKEVGNDIEI
jgi:hypothetical protein